MKRAYHFLLALGVLMILGVGFNSCSNEPDNPYEISPEPGRLVLIYAVAANSLEYNLTEDMNEILSVAPSLDLDKNKVLIYAVRNDNICRLLELRKVKNKKDEYEYVELKTYPDLPLSTSGERISDVLEFVASNYQEYERKGLILWSHATGWIPWFAGSTPINEDRRKAFGEDKYDGGVYKTDITELADAVPYGVFDYIWFDCCYMANIETVYQLREKTDYIAGYVTEIAAAGMPYHVTMPYLIKKDADLEGAASQLYTYYNDLYIPVSVSIMKTDGLEYLADVCRDIFSSCRPPLSLSEIQYYNKYSNLIPMYFYDMRQFLDSSQGIDAGLKENLKEAFEKAVIFKRIASNSFLSNYIKYSQEKYSGLSIYNYTDTENGYDSYYRRLDWYKATR